MKSIYRPIGDFIRLVNERNKDLSVKDLRGLSMTKEFREPTSNIIGTDMSIYKIVRKNQFACDFMSVIRVYKLPVVLHDKEKPIIVSPAYPVFEVIDESVLLPEYLMMWMRRTEFDRYAFFKCDSAIRGGFGWEEFCEVNIPVPDIEIQKEIVKEYKAIVNRIELNNQLIQKLEETAQAVYKRWFVDFEFPDENGKPYKSNGGEMEYNEEFELEIPKEWEIKPTEALTKDIICGKTPPTANKENYGDFMPFVTIPDMHNKVYANRTERRLSQKGVNTQKNKTLPLNSVCVSCIATAGLVLLTSEDCQTNQQINSIICKKEVSPFYVYFMFKNMGEKIKEWGMKGTVGANISKTEFSQIEVMKPSPKVMELFDKKIQPFFDMLKFFQNELNLLEDTKSILFSKMSKLIPVEVVSR